MSGILVLTHGDLAKVLLATAERILGESDPAVVPMCLDWDQGSAAATEGLKKAIKKLQDKHGSVLVLTDLFGGTPTNLAMTFYKPGKVDILTGMNLPMVVKAILLRKSEKTTLADMVRELRERGQGAIVSAGEVMGPAEGTGE